MGRTTAPPRIDFYAFCAAALTGPLESPPFQWFPRYADRSAVELFGFFFKRRITIAAYNIDFFCGPDNRPATGTNIFAGTVGFLASSDMGDRLAVKVKFAIVQALDKGFRFIGQDRLAIPIFGVFLDD